MASKVDERRLFDDILDHLNEDPRVNAAEVKVDVSERGTATLRGTVPDYVARRAAEQAALAAGARKVQNFLVVPLSDPADLTHPMAPGDDGLRARVNQYLRGQDVLSAENIDVLVEDGVVTLEGSVDAFWKRHRAEEVVLGVEGARQAVNHLAVVPGHKADDRDIAVRIMDGLEHNTLLDAQAIDVKVRNALVTLRGAVPGPRAKWEAFQIALWTEGVADVRDELEIAPPEGPRVR
jgi:osmotically-inducible protein OsmY